MLSLDLWPPDLRLKAQCKMQRDETVLSRRRRRCVHEFATTADGFERTTKPSAASLQFWPRLPTGVFTPTTRRNCRQLVANSCTHRRRDETRQFRLVGGVYWAWEAYSVNWSKVLSLLFRSSLPLSFLPFYLSSLPGSLGQTKTDRRMG